MLFVCSTAGQEVDPASSPSAPASLCLASSLAFEGLSTLLLVLAPPDLTPALWSRKFFPRLQRSTDPAAYASLTHPLEFEAEAVIYDRSFRLDLVFSDPFPDFSADEVAATTAHDFLSYAAVRYDAVVVSLPDSMSPTPLHSRLAPLADLFVQVTRPRGAYAAATWRFLEKLFVEQPSARQKTVAWLLGEPLPGLYPLGGAWGPTPSLSSIVEAEAWLHLAERFRFSSEFLSFARPLLALALADQIPTRTS